MQLCYSGGMLSFLACLFCSQHTSILPSLALRCAFVIGHNSSRVFLLSLSFDLKRLLESDLQNVMFNQTFHEYFFVHVRVQGQRLDDYFCAIIFSAPEKKFLQYWFIKTSDVQENVGGWGGGGRNSRPTCLPKQTQSLRALCASPILSRSQHRRKLIITFLPVNSEVADMKSDVLLRELKWEVYSSIICHCLSQGCRKANICQLNWAQKSNTERQTLICIHTNTYQH